MIEHVHYCVMEVFLQSLQAIVFDVVRVYENFITNSFMFNAMYIHTPF